jgi:hypothetical protein
VASIGIDVGKVGREEGGGGGGFPSVDIFADAEAPIREHVYARRLCRHVSNDISH